MTGETVENNGEQQGAGASVLENMPSFEEHMDEAEKIKYGAEIAEEKQFAKEDLSFTVSIDGKAESFDFPGEQEVQEGLEKEGFVAVDTHFDGIPLTVFTETDFLVARHLAKKINSEILASPDQREQNHKGKLLGRLWFEYAGAYSLTSVGDITGGMRFELEYPHNNDREEVLARDRELIEQIEYGRKAYDAFLDSRKAD